MRRTGKKTGLKKEKGKREGKTGKKKNTLPQVNIFQFYQLKFI